MSNKLEVSFNSPQCGWMSVGFTVGENEFHTTTAHSPHVTALPQLMSILTEIGQNHLRERVDGTEDQASPKEYLLKWNRAPEEFDFRFVQNGDNVTLEIYQFPTDERNAAERELVFSHTGKTADIVVAFAETFDQLYEDRDTDQFEFNWRQPFPYDEFLRFKSAVNSVK